MGIMTKTLTGIALVGVGYIAGNSCNDNIETQSLDGMYLQNTNKGIHLVNEEQNKTYQLNKINKEIFLGDANHNALGFKELTKMEIAKMYAVKK